MVAVSSRAARGARAFLAVRWLEAASRVLPVRAELIATGRQTLSASRSIAALDVGWVGAATEATVVDLAGVTDLAIAALPGGHTSKTIPVTLLDARGVDTLVFLRRQGCAASCVRPDGGPFDRAVEERLAREPWVSESFTVGAIIRAGTLTYVVMRRKPAT